MAKKTNAQIKQEVNEALLADLLALYTHAEEQMLKKVAKRVAKGITEEGWNEMKSQDTSELRQEISALLNNPSKQAKSKMGKDILKAYKEGVNEVEKEAGKPLTAMSQLDIPLSIQNLLLANYDLIDNAHLNIIRKVEDAYRDYMVESASMVLAGVETRAQASQRMMDRLAAKGITTFVDKAGRTWDMGSYTEMAIRTATAHAALEGRIQTQESLGFDLMQVSRIGTTCPICAKWQGVVISIGGKTPGYHTVEQARAAGLFHPNCKHTLVMWDPEINGQGQMELNSDAEVEAVTKVYDLTQQQRANERAIRHWKRRAAAAIDPKMKAKYQDRATQATIKNIMFCEKNGLVRKPAREGIRNPKAENAQFIDWFGKHLMGYSEYEMAKVILDESTLKQLLKDKSESLTTLYKKYIGENPSQDYKSVGDTQLTYAQWLKAKVMELTQDMPDPNEVKYITIPAKFTPLELKMLLKTKSLTEVYKEHISGSPSQDYKNNYSGPLTYAQWLKAQVGDLTMEKVVPANMTEQGQAEIGIAKGTTPLGDKPLDGAVKQAYATAMQKMLEPAAFSQYETIITDVLQGAYWADEAFASEMDKKGQAAIVKNGKIYINPHKQGTIFEHTIMHELGHLMTHKGLKATQKDFDNAAETVMQSLGYGSFKEMAFQLGSNATISSQEFFADAFMFYNNDMYQHLTGEQKEIIAEAMKAMYFKQKAQPQAQQTDTETFDDYVKKGKEAFEKAINLGASGIQSAKVGFAYAMGYDAGYEFADGSDVEDFNDDIFDPLSDKELWDAWLGIKNKSISKLNAVLGFAAKSNPDDIFNSKFLEEFQKKSTKLKDKGVTKAKASKTKTSKPKAAKPKDLITETDKENFAKAKQMWDEKIAKDGKMGFGTLKMSVAQVFGIDILEPDGLTKFNPIWDEVKKAVSKKKGPFAPVNLTTLNEIVEPLFDKGNLEDFLAFDTSHPVSQAKAQAEAEKAAVAKAKAEAKAQAQAQAMAAAVQAAKGASGYKMGAGSLTEKEVDAFITEHKDHHLYGGSTEGKAQAKRLKDAQKKYMKEKYGMGSPSRSAAQSLESQVAKALREGDEETLKKVGPIWALYDYSKASGVYNWFKRGNNRGRSVNSSDHPLGRGMTEWEYGEKLAPLIDEYFKDMPGLEEDVYVHRVFGEDALQNLFGIETDKAKAAVDLSDAIKYAKKHPGETIIRDKGYLSTSTFTEGDWNGNCEIRIKLNKGTKAAFLGGVEAHSVNETLVQANQKMRVNAVYERADYSLDEWYKLAQEKGFNPSKKIAIFAETVVDEAYNTARTAKEVQIGEMLASQSGYGASRTALDLELRMEFNQGAKNWTSSEKSGVKAYSGSDYRWMNTALRNDTLSSRSTSEQNKVKNTIAALDKVRTTQDRIYRRGSDFDALLGMLGENMTRSEFDRILNDDPEYFNSGTRIAYDKGLLSTTPYADRGFSGDVEFRIFAPAGTKAIYMAPVSQHSSEEETLFQASSKHRLISIRKMSSLTPEEKQALKLDIGNARYADYVAFLETLVDD